MAEKTHILCHYDEIALKGKNRPWFEKKLRHNIRFALEGIAPELQIANLHGRILVTLVGEAAWEEIENRLKKVCGIAYFAQVFSAPPTMEELKAALAGRLPREEKLSFAVRAKRQDKSFSLTTPEIGRDLGAWIVRETGWKVNLTQPDITVHLEWLHENVWFYFNRTEGPGGLPIGVSGRVLCLISGGIDSPVAAYLMMKRACQVEFIHFHSFPFTDAASQEKVRTLIETLCRHRCSTRLYMAPFAELQQEIVSSAPSSYRIILYRRFMIRVAQEVARQENLQALVTGDSLGQVASQTLENLVAIEAVARIPVLRPLIGLNKQEIIEWAKKIGTFPISIRPHGDCCSWLMPRNPELSANVEEVRKIEENLPVEELVEKNLSRITREEF